MGMNNALLVRLREEDVAEELEVDEADLRWRDGSTSGMFANRANTESTDKALVQRQKTESDGQAYHQS